MTISTRANRGSRGLGKEEEEEDVDQHRGKQREESAGKWRRKDEDDDQHRGKERE